MKGRDCFSAGVVCSDRPISWFPRPGLTPAVVVAALLVMAVIGSCQPVRAQSQVIYETSFEASEGYSIDADLAGQKGWVSEGSGGNGLITEFFMGMGQQAYIGFAPPANREDLLNVWRPINYKPLTAGVSVVRFSVSMQINRSTNGFEDDFRWSVYNAEGKRLFTLDFEGLTGIISSISDAGQFKDTGVIFDYGAYYELIIWMNFSRNLWTATLNDLVIVNSEPLTTSNLALSLGDVDAVWFVRNPGAAGDNFMIFDDYRITAETVPSIPPHLEIVERKPSGEFVLRLWGEAGLKYSFEVSEDFKFWDSLGIFQTGTDGTQELEDTSARNYPMSFYRVLQVAP